jgi:hypothetical protein
MINAPPFETTDQRPSRTGDARKEAKTTRTKLGWSLGGNGRDGAPWRWMSVVRQMHDRFLRLHDFHRSDVFRHHSLQQDRINRSHPRSESMTRRFRSPTPSKRIWIGLRLKALSLLFFHPEKEDSKGVLKRT